MRKMPWGIKKLLNLFEILIKLIKKYFVFIRYEFHSRHSRDRLDEAHYTQWGSPRTSGAATYRPARSLHEPLCQTLEPPQF
jgi:hypothetical protein